MKRVLYLAMAVAFLAGCKGQQEQTEIQKDSVMLEPCTILSEMDDMQVVAIPDKVNVMSADLFKGSYDDSLLTAIMPDGTSPSAINVFLINASGYYNDGRDYDILIDAGLGEEAGGTLLSHLKDMEFKPGDIDAVCLTHLHPDHIGGLVNKGQPVFPNAEIYLSVEEFNAWSDDGPMAEQNGLWKQVLACYADKINLFQDGDTLIDGWVVAHLAPGHTPGHTVYESGLCLFIGDLVHAQDLQMKHPEFCARFDNNPAQAVDTRRKWLTFARKNPWRYVSGAHCYNPFIRGEQ